MPKQDATESRLRAAIFANPDDDAPRLVYADWLLERGDPRGEFIQIQCRLGRPVGGSSTTKLGTNHPMMKTARSNVPDRVLEARERALLRAHQKTWIAPIRKYINSWFWERGYICQVDVSANKLIAHFASILEFAPLRGLYLMGSTPALLRQFSENPLVSAIPSLSIDMQRIGAREAEMFRSPHFAQLQRLSLRQNPLGDEAVNVLASSTTLRSLQSLDLSFSQVELTSQGIERLASAAFFPNLTELVLDCSLARRTAIAPILKRGTKLKSLSLGNQGITKDEAKLRARRGLDEPD